ncbi:GNAT family N-acetyltransferase [Mycobacterium sp. Marseille-P9652]|uniref:GNAT family N-acetyltransferase n=1 Tax=Mycobacterium sp. Marseille-P9652 TaxID=2654950 RepID=UPI0012E7427D|nr:GNAT family N-acetyltransferase [Mycobacterium sp. Marseille-P9652]
MESVIRAESLTVSFATPDSVDTTELAALAAQTFPLACPPATTTADIAAFVAANLSAERFAEYLADPARAILTARHGGRIIGYAMVIREDDRAEVSKMYVLPDHHRTGASAALMELALDTAARWGVASVWLGVNQGNERAQRFYAKHGFAVSGTRTFRVGDRLENDYLMTRELRR